MAGLSSKALELGLRTVAAHHGQLYAFKGRQFMGVAGDPVRAFGPGPIGMVQGRDYEVTIRALRKDLGALPVSGDALMGADGKRYVVGGVKEQPGGVSVQFYCRINNY